MSVELKNKLNENDLEIRLVIGEDCNLSCTYCIADASKKYFQRTEDFLNLLYKLKDKYDNIVLTFSGGEPLLYLDYINQKILYLASTILDKKLDIKILTNGIKLNDSKVRSRLRFMKSMYNLELIVSVHNTLASLNKQLAWLTQSGINYYTRKPVTAYMELSLGDVSGIDDVFPAHNNRTGIKTLGTKEQFLLDGKSATLNDVWEKTQFNFKNWKCQSGKDLICIDVDGFTYPCSMYLHRKFNPVDINDYQPKETTCSISECWCFSSKKEK